MLFTTTTVMSSPLVQGFLVWLPLTAYGTGEEEALAISARAARRGAARAHWIGRTGWAAGQRPACSRRYRTPGARSLKPREQHECRHADAARHERSCNARGQENAGSQNQFGVVVHLATMT